MKEQNLERSLPIYFGQQKAILFQIQAFRFTNSILIDPNWTNNKLIEKNHQSVPKLGVQSGRSKVDGLKWTVKSESERSHSDTGSISESGPF